MKTRFWFAIVLFSSCSFGQLLTEDFDYTTGVLTTVSANWTESPGESFDIEVINGSLNYTNYPSSGVGNKIALNGGASGRSGVVRAFTSQSGNGTTVYYSFLLNVTSTSDMDINTSEGARFMNLKVSGSTSFRACPFVRQGANNSKFQLGLGKLSSSVPSWYGTELDINTTYLIVLAYVFQSGSDAARLWINPSLSGEEPTADIEQTTGSDASSLEEIQLRQEPKSGDMEIDGIRVATTWSQAPLPVELTSFTAKIIGKNVSLNWQTATEVDNYGFEIQRASSSITPIRDWTTIGFVKGHGNSNSTKNYSFTDKTVISSGKYFYRLKQVDTDGKIDFSGVIEADFGIPDDIELYQNYPNPFNPYTTINYSLPAVGSVTLKVYNILGTEIATLVNEHQTAGMHEIKFDGSKFSSGVYFYTLSSNGFSKTKKFILLK